MSENLDTHYNFKRISVENWNKVDEVFAHLMAGSSAEAFVSGALNPELQTSVPEEVRALFEVARGTIIYGIFFYPLLALGAEQCHRVAETAVAAKSKAIKPGQKVEKFIPFKRNVDELIAKGVIAAHDAEEWHIVVQLRNHASHPARQSIHSPGMAIETLLATAKRINSLFPCSG